MTQSVSVAIVSSALMKLGKRRHNLSSLMTHDLSFAWLPAPQPPWPVGHFGGSQTRPALSFTPGGGRGAVTHCPWGAGGGVWPVLTAPRPPCSGPHCLPWVIAVALGLGACVYSPPTAARRTLWRHHEITSQLLKATLPLPQVRPTSPCLAVLSHFRGVGMFVTLSLPLCPSLCDPMDCSLPGSSVSGILLARILEWVAVPASRRSFRPRDWNCVSYGSCIGRWFFTTNAIWEAQFTYNLYKYIMAMSLDISYIILITIFWTFDLILIFLTF